jgi:hypothetical protein
MAVPFSAASGVPGAADSVSSTTRSSIEWTIYAVLVASASIVVGLVWDISWHRTIGRDTFWAPPHLLQQAGAIISGLSCGYLALSTTFGGSYTQRSQSVRFWRLFQAPIGAWVCIWGTITMITSAPFDNWWHNAYGLDVKIISPPHIILASGMIAVEIGAILMSLGAQNRATDEGEKRKFGFIYACGASVVVLMLSIMLTEDAAYGNEMHGSSFYIATGMVLPLFMVAFARASRLTWPATRIAIGYMLITMIAIWVLQLVPAQPKLAPIYNPVTRMVPPAFPLLLFAPAIAIDLALDRLKGLNDWMLSVVVGIGFVAAMLAVHWFWAGFLLSPAARNFFFGVDHWDYSSKLGPWRYQFWNLDIDRNGAWSASAFAGGMTKAVLYAIISTRIGLAWGRGMARVKR